MDGYALRRGDLAGTRRLRVVGESACGMVPANLEPGTTMRIFTGAPLPIGADCVVMQEDVVVRDGIAQFPEALGGDGNVRRRGEDFRSGEVLYERGRRLGPSDVALLSAAGVGTLEVWSRPRVLVFATGDELVSPGTPLRPGQIYESNRIATILQMRALGAEVVDGGTIADSAERIRGVLRDAQEFDFVITSGGASVGDHDLVKGIFAEIGSIEFWRVKIKPGKPLAFGRVGGRTHFFALPGNPVSSLVTFKLFVEPALHAWSHSVHNELKLSAVAANDCRRAPGRMEFLRARLSTQDGNLIAEALPGQGSHMLGTLRATNGLIQIDAESEGFRRGDRVTAIPLTLNIT
jgi:molybdopterin molybdotransferase